MTARLMLSPRTHILTTTHTQHITQRPKDVMARTLACPYPSVTADRPGVPAVLWCRSTSVMGALMPFLRCHAAEALELELEFKPPNEQRWEGAKQTDKPRFALGRNSKRAKKKQEHNRKQEGEMTHASHRHGSPLVARCYCTLGVYKYFWLSIKLYHFSEGQVEVEKKTLFFTRCEHNPRPYPSTHTHTTLLTCPPASPITSLCLPSPVVQLDGEVGKLKPVLSAQHPNLPRPRPGRVRRLLVAGSRGGGHGHGVGGDYDVEGAVAVHVPEREHRGYRTTYMGRGEGGGIFEIFFPRMRCDAGARRRKGRRRAKLAEHAVLYCTVLYRSSFSRQPSLGGR